MGTPSASVRSRAGLLVLLAVLVVGAGGCRLDLAVDVVVGRDGAGTVRLELAADEDLLARARAAGADPLTALAEHEELRRAGWTVTDRSNGSGQRVTLSVRFTGPEAFSMLMADLAEALAAPEGAVLGPMTMELREDLVVLDGWAALEPGPGMTELGLLPEDAVRLARDNDFVGYTLRIALPGPVREHTADELEGRTLTWRIAPGERVHVRAVGERPGPALWPFGLGVAVALVLAALVLARVARRRRSTFGPHLVRRR